MRVTIGVLDGLSQIAPAAHRSKPLRLGGHWRATGAHFFALGHFASGSNCMFTSASRNVRKRAVATPDGPAMKVRHG